MARANIGGQRIGWKFSTPLKAEYLSSFLSGFSNAGLLTRPELSVTSGTSTPMVTIKPFSILIEPTDLQKDVGVITKITFTLNTDLQINNTIVAIGVTYSFRNENAEQSEWYAEFETLTQAEVEDYKGVIIATVQSFKPDNIEFFSVTTSGADISDALLRNEGWNPNCWLSLISPRRSIDGKFNVLEVRKHNERYSGYMSGTEGVLWQNNLTYQINARENPVSNPDGIRGYMPHNYNIFALQSNGFFLCEEGMDGNTPPDESNPITKQPGGVFAMVDATKVNNANDVPGATGNDSQSFANELEILPVQKEDINVYYDDTDSTFYIR